MENSKFMSCQLIDQSVALGIGEMITLPSPMSTRLPEHSNYQSLNLSLRIRTGAKLRVDNLHYDLNEEDLEGLFSRIGPVTTISIRYDRAGRSDGTAYVTYESLSDARMAIREYDGANANGQPIRLTLVPSVPPNAARGPRNPFDTAQKPSRSLFDRISSPGRRARNRSSSPERPRLSDTSKPAPEGIDRYVPGERTRSPLPRRGGRDGGRRPGARREESGRDGGRKEARDGRPRKTQEELDAEMEDYWGNRGGDAEVNGKPTQNGGGSGAATTVVDDGDIDMIE
ncbi:MAG: hypothetical protein M1827_004768 [Pycnora praestabilis]|nr:MAG: hypothetical protein M1827_004768 [Pycnora praestabilis]